MNNKRLDIVMHALGMPFDGQTIQRASLGGSETAAYYQARELAKRGHRVNIFTGCAEAMEADGVTYVPAGPVTNEAPLGRDFEHYARNTPHDVLIIQRHPMAFQAQFASKVNIWQLHDLALLRYAALANNAMWNIDAVTCVSEWHRQQVLNVYGFDPKFVQVVRNGVDLNLYDVPHERADVVAEQFAGFEGLKLLYQSRPERGLEHLVRPNGIMHQLAQAGVQAQLFICSYQNTVAEMSAHYEQLRAWNAALPNVVDLGALTKNELARAQRFCDLLVYPTEFEEVSCISVMEAAAAGLPVLTSTVGALYETLAEGGAEFIPLLNDQANEAAFVERITALAEDADRLRHLSNAQLTRASHFSWERAVDDLEALCHAKLTRGSLSAKVRHAIEHSDIGAAERIAFVDYAAEEVGKLPIVEAARDELDQLYQFAGTQAAYKAHYDLHQSKYYDDHGARAIGEDVTGSTRFRAVAQFFADEYARDRKANLRVLDYGCAHGHYLVPLAQAFPHWSFTGVDVSARAIGAATAWIGQIGLPNVRLLIGDQALLGSDLLCPRELVIEDRVVGDDCIRSTESGPRELYDVILAGEVVEHVPNWLALLEDLRHCLKPGGLLIVTTPHGRWEWSGTEAFRHAREHLHHFSRRDIEEICATNQVRLLYAPARPDRTGSPLGSWVWAVRCTQPFTSFDQARHLHDLAPRETVSACLIVKDGEKTIRRCIESFIDWVDEIVIAIDPATTDRTDSLLEQLADDFKWKPFRIISGVKALEHGFHAARNHALKAASGDWILWLDADEEVQQPWNLWKYLRPSHHSGFGFPQVHYACDPPQVLTTDYPCRLFRRDSGAQFYGFVHEHPETAPGHALPHATIKHDVQFLHCGYVDEATRRQRYERNLPLLARDMQAFPDRKLNRFLWLRDIAQGLVYFIERTGGIGEAQLEQAREGIKLFETMVDAFDGSRMIIDAVQYYTQCVVTLNQGFDAELTFSTTKEPLRDLAARGSVKGRFHSVALFEQLSMKLLRESVKRYEDKYL